MKAFFFIACFLSFLNSFSQDSLLNYLLISETPQQSILIRWEIEGGNTCNGIEIYRSTDNVQFELIHSIDGICGNVSTPVAYQYEDENPVSNQTNYYRIKLGLGDPSRSVSLFFIELNTEGYYLYPNPTEGQVKIYFKNENGEFANLLMMNSTGQTIITSRVNTEFWEPDLTYFPSGVYFFSIEINEKLIQGRFIKN